MPACTISVEIPPGGVAIVPDLTGELTATDNRTPLHLLIVEQEPPAGTLVSAGAYIITTTITDQSGNQTVCTNTFCVTSGGTVGPFYNTAQSYVAFCPAGTTGVSKTAMIPAGTFSSTASQEAADNLALGAAIAQANAALCCCVPGEDCPECPPVGYPYGFGFEHTYDLYEYPFCYPYLYGCPELPALPSSDIDHWWKMEEALSATRRDAIATVPADLSASVVSGTIGNVAGKVNFACEQTGSNVNLQHTASTQILYGNTGLTLFGWLKAGTASNSMLVDYDLKFGGSVDRLRLAVAVAASGDMTFAFTENVSNDPVVPSIIVAGGVGSWIFVRMWHDGPNGKLRLQLNNGTIYESPTAWTPGAHTSADLIFYGSTSPRYWDEWGLIYRVFTADEASYIWNGGAGRTWPFA